MANQMISSKLEPWHDLSGKVVMVTGASSGIGWDFCIDLAKAGCRIVAAARRIDRLMSLCDEINGPDNVGAVAVELDVRAKGPAIEASVKKAWDAFGRIDCVINNAGVRETMSHGSGSVNARISKGNLGTILELSDCSRVTAAKGWFLMSGTTSHVSGTRSDFVDYHPVTRRYVTSFDGRRSEVIGVGTVELRFATGQRLTLEDVLHVPSVSKGLVSASKLVENGYFVSLGNKVTIFKPSRIITLAQGSLHDGMYRLELEDEPLEISDGESSIGSNSV